MSIGTFSETSTRIFDHRIKFGIEYQHSQKIWEVADNLSVDV